jgi:dimethylamine monooxygenase subunit A
MGLRPLALADWLEVDGWRAADLERKARLLEDHADEVCVSLPGSEVAAAELLAEVSGHLASFHPDVASTPVGPAVRRVPSREGSRRHTIVEAALLVQEDLCLLEEREGAWVLAAACVCFPSRWSLAAKRGASLDEIHRPVPGYAESLAVPVARLFDRLRPERPVGRLNWSILETPELFLPAPARERSEGEAGDPASLWFRVERQTLRRLPRSGAVCFTIRTYVDPLGTMVVGHPERRAALAEALASMDEAAAGYKGLAWRRAAICAWLDDLGA